jgi:hypothetical protein
MKPMTFTVTVEVERASGPFASRDELTEQVCEALNAADLGELTGENGGVYYTVAWDAEVTP